MTYTYQYIEGPLWQLCLRVNRDGVMCTLPKHHSGGCNGGSYDQA